MLHRLAEIVHHMQKRQYQRANDAYLRLSIGNAPWPIGVTMVGLVHFALSWRGCKSVEMLIHDFSLVFSVLHSIHERSAREKISSDQVAHVLNDEVSRKYIQSLKRSVCPTHPHLTTKIDVDCFPNVRLLTFSQTKYPPEDVSQLMG